MKNRTIWFGIGIAAVIVLVAVAMAMTKPKATMDMSNADVKSAVSTSQVMIQNYMFSPMVIKVKAGTKVTWINMDEVHHSVTADQSSSDAPNGPLIAKGQSYSFTFKKAGTYTFHCQPHPYMHGTVIVTD